jgi:hypothetical protein
LINLAAVESRNYALRMSRLMSLLLLATAFETAVPTFAQTRAGGEFQVNASTLGDQLTPSVAVAKSGDFVVVWSSTTGGGIYGRRYDASGVSLGSEFRVDNSTTVAKITPAVGADRNGNFTVVWDHSNPNSIRGRRFAAGGQPTSPEMLLTTGSVGDLRQPRIDTAPKGWFLLSFLDASNGYGFSWWSPAFVLLCGHGNSSGADGGVAGTLRPDLSWTAVSSIASQGLNVGHVSNGCENPFPTLTTVTPPGAVSPAIDSDDDGNAVLVWASASDGDQTGIRGLRLGPSSAPLGSEFQVNAYTTGAQSLPSVAVAADGSFVVAWQSSVGDGSGDTVFARRFRADGSPRENDFVVNVYTTGAQRRPVAATDANGNFVVAWESDGQDGDGIGVFAQRFGGLRTTAVAVDPFENGVLEPDETVTVAPSWRNVSGVARHVVGAATSFTGPGAPGNPSYLLTGPTADYGTVADGATASCATTTGDCFAVGVSQPSPRPALHWDARLREEIVPASLGETQAWTLHVGDSFSDVPRTNPFYRFIETLLHRGVTGGCNGTSYCPAAPTLREQMAAFVLLAREGPGFGTSRFELRRCLGTPLFSDVPVTSPYCPWVEELARRGVVNGCGGGRYCPADPVSREQMAVFVLSTLEGLSFVPPPCAIPTFADVPVSSPFCPWITELARRGVVSGCGGGNYCPSNPVTREQMGVFLGVTFGLTLYAP